MTTRVFLSGIHASGRHGANPGEKDEPQPFVVDLDVEIVVGRDDVAETADYRALAHTARRVVETESFDLVEHLAAAVARAVLSMERVRRATAVVHKPGAARSIGIDGVAVAATVGED